MAELLLETDAEQSELHRRRLLAQSDRLLDRVEQLRLMEQRTVPPALAAAVRTLQVRLGQTDPARPRTARAAQNLVFAVQQRLMAANPRAPQPRAHPGRAAGSPRIASLPDAGRWKLLSLPPRGAAQDDEEWRELVALTVTRALDRWSWAQGRAVGAARDRPREAPRLVARARVAWANYWELRCDAEVLLGERLPATGRAQPP
jgi:hypothetical protein